MKLSLPSKHAALVGLGESHLTHIKFGRNRFLRVAGATLFGTAISVMLPTESAMAYPDACYGFAECPCCYHEICCESGCMNVGYLGCYSGQQCWYAQASNGIYYKCCDWKRSNGSPCLCYTATTCC